MRAMNAPTPRLETALVFLGFSALGIGAMAPSVTFGDAGEFTACAATLSLAHAPSYPLLAVLGKALGSLWLFGNWAYRTNLLSALCGAAALALLVSALRRAGLSLAGRLGAVLLLGLCPLWRYESGVTEVFALHALALAAVLWLLCRFAPRLYAERPMAALGLTAGLGMANHHTLALAAPTAAWEVWRSWRLCQPRRARELARGTLVLLIFCGLGLGLYLLLPIRARANPPFDWGHPVDLRRFLWVFLRKDYGSLSLTVEGAAPWSAGAIWSQLLRYLRASVAGLGPAGLGLAALGLASARGLRPGAFGLGLWICFTGPFFLFLGNPPFDSQTSSALERFYLGSWMGLAMLAAAGIDCVERRWKPAAWLLALLPVAGGWFSQGQWWLRYDLAAYDYGRSVIRSLPPSASLFMDGGDDTFYTTAYLTMAEGMRPDLALHDRGGVVFRSAYGPGFRSLSAPAKEARRAQVESVLAADGKLWYSTLKDELLPGLALEPWGLLRRPVAPAAGKSARPARPSGLWELYPFRWRDELLASHYRDRALVCFYPVMKAAALRAAGRLPAALRELQLAWTMGPDVLWLAPQVGLAAQWLGYEAAQRGDWALAEPAFDLAHAAQPLSAQTYANLGTVYERTGRWTQALDAYQEAARLDPGSQKAYYNLGAFYWGRSRWAEAAAAFEAAARIDPGHAAAAGYAAQARRRAGTIR